MKRTTSRLILLILFLELSHGLQYSSAGAVSAFGFASASQVKNKPQSTVSMTQLKEEGVEENFPPDIEFEEKSDKIQVEENRGTPADHIHPDTIQTECDATKNEENFYDVSMEVSYEFKNEFPGTNIKENDPKKQKNISSKAISLYLDLLQSSALLTKCLTSGFIGGIGDICAQMFENKISRNRLFAIDRLRVFGIAFECVAISGPLMHYAYDFLESIVPIHELESDDTQSVNKSHKNHSKTPIHMWAAAIFHVVSDTFFLGPVYVLSIMVSSSFFEGRIGTIKKDLAMNFLPTLKVSIFSSIGFMPMQVTAFRILPTQFRLLYMNIQDIIWNAVVSFMAHKSIH